MSSKWDRRKWRAHAQVQIALRKGKLVRPDHCEDCSEACKPEAHHEDYEKQLEVQWLCRSCHMKRWSRLVWARTSGRIKMPKATRGLKLLSTKQVAEICGVSPRTVAQWLREGTLKGIKLNKFTWRVREADLYGFIEERQEAP